MNALQPSPMVEDVIEVDDAPTESTTPYALTDHSATFLGEVEDSGDRDWVATTLVEGESYRITLDGLTLRDPYLRVYDLGCNHRAGATRRDPGSFRKRHAFRRPRK